MKFIPGNSFTNRTTKFGRYFKRGNTYTIKKISPKDGKFKYIFISSDGEKEIIFNTVKEADDFLSNF